MRKIYLSILFIILIISCYPNKNIMNLPIIQEEIQFIDTIETIESIAYGNASSIKKDSIIIDDVHIEEIQHTPYIKNNTEKGTLIYQIDSFFIINTTSRVEAKIIKEKYDTIPKYIIETFSKNKSGKIKKYIIPVGNIMNMELISLDKDIFNINKISSDNQEVSDNVIAEWIWGVTPLKIGNYTLILKAIIKENNTNKDIIVFDKQINVLNKPKKHLLFNIKYDDIIKNKNNILYLEIKDDSVCSNLEWGGDGNIILEIENEEDFEIIKSDSYVIVDNKNHFEYKWVIKPLGKTKYLKYKIYINGDLEKILISENEIKIKNNLKYSFNKFIDNTIKRWYYIIFTLLIPAYFWIKKKMKKN